MTKRVSIFVSGSGSNAEQLYKYFQNSRQIDIVSVFSNKKDAGIFERAKLWNIPVRFCSNADFENSTIQSLLDSDQVDVILLAGFLKKIPTTLLNDYENRIINIHPALLPKYGGKGMYGMHVHQKVKENNDTISGITIHLVNAEFDSGEILFQKSCNICSSDSAEDIAAKVQALEHQYYPVIAEEYIINRLK
ncbi:MAG: phosphoribosylglycinamide formyltransferase [Bacteroidales bacterium]